MLQKDGFYSYFYLFIFAVGVLLISGCQSVVDESEPDPNELWFSHVLVSSEALGSSWQESIVSTHQESVVPDEENHYLVESAARILTGFYGNRTDNYFLTVMHKVNYYEQPVSWLDGWQFTEDLDLSAPQEVTLDIPHAFPYFAGRCLQEMPDSETKTIAVCQVKQGFDRFVVDLTIYAPANMPLADLTNLLEQISVTSEEKILALVDNGDIE